MILINNNLVLLVVLLLLLNINIPNLLICEIKIVTENNDSDSIIILRDRKTGLDPDSRMRLTVKLPVVPPLSWSLKLLLTEKSLYPNFPRIHVVEEKNSLLRGFKESCHRYSTELWRNAMMRNTPYLSVFSPNAGKYGLEKLQIWTIFKQCLILIFMQKNQFYPSPLSWDIT